MNDDVKKICKNYNIIVNCEFLEDDLFSRKLVDFYKNAVIRCNNDSKNLNKIVKYDRVVRKYIEDYNFSKKLRNSIDISTVLNSNVDLTENVLDYAIDFSERYDDSLEQTVINTRRI